MHVTMLESRSVSPDGATIVFVDAGQTIELTDGLAQRLIDRGVAAKAADVPAAPPTEPKEAEPDVPVAVVDDPIAGLNAKDAVAAIATLTLEQLDGIPDDPRKSVNDAIAARLTELEATQKSTPTRERS